MTSPAVGLRVPSGFAVDAWGRIEVVNTSSVAFGTAATGPFGTTDQNLQTFTVRIAPATVQ